MDFSVYAHADAKAQITINDQSIDARGAVITIGSDLIIFAPPEIVARLQGALTAYMAERTAPPSAEILRMPQGRARRPLSPNDGPEAA